MSGDPAGRLAAFVAEELAVAIRADVRAFAARIAARGGAGVVGVLFYGSAIRTGAVDGLLDFYVLLDDFAAWDAGAAATAAGRILPPNIEYAEEPGDGALLRAKVAILTLTQFRAHARALSLDTTIWARFAQPAALAFARDAAAAAEIADAVALACRSASWWAAHLTPAPAPAAEFWAGLFGRTYASELRIERSERPRSLIDHAPERYERVLRMAWAAEGLTAEAGPDGRLDPQVAAPARADAERAWRLRKRLAKPLNMARIAKASFTFSGGADYIAWKVERHSGHRIEVTPWQRRHPLLAAGPVLWRLWRQGLLR